MHAVVAGPSFLRTLCSDATQTASGLACAMSDVEGRVVMGAVPPDANSATRAAATSNLPWTVHLYEPPGQNHQPSSRGVLLLSMFAGVGLVLGAGWYFILRAISREARVSRLQTDFVAAVSHEFRSPLTSLSHIAEMLATDRLPDERLRRQSYGVLVRDTDRLRRLVETLLDFGRFESGNAAFRAEPADLCAVVRHTVDEFQEHVRADGYRLDLSAPPEVVHVHVDRDAFARALWNLLDNAVKYSGDSRMVRVAIAPAGESVALTVADEGLGIPAHERGEIFERFVRGSESKARRIKGTGIGLALARQIVRAHGGEIELTSEVGRGSTFRLLLPVSKGAQEIPQPALEVTP
jgi:two-component system sensor histidine kinase VicK